MMPKEVTFATGRFRKTSDILSLCLASAVSFVNARDGSMTSFYFIRKRTLTFPILPTSLAHLTRAHVAHELSSSCPSSSHPPYDLISSHLAHEVVSPKTCG
ncbi:hypothetical protein P3342_002591 [Pyrenophora teres f. teres]|nr:hypothetical protein P3342_002591 [Pyrenophora teres f. teres]